MRTREPRDAASIPAQLLETSEEQRQEEVIRDLTSTPIAPAERLQAVPDRQLNKILGRMFDGAMHSFC